MPEPTKPEAPKRLSAAEEVELEFKRLQVELMRDQIAAREAQKEYSRVKIEKMVADMKAAEREMQHRQRVCAHRKGGKNNQFAKGNDQNRSIVQNTYPMGEISIMCSRCFKTVWRPELKLKKSDPKLYEAMLAEWKEWSSWPTDNTPSGSKIFEVQVA